MAIETRERYKAIGNFTDDVGQEFNHGDYLTVDWDEVSEPHRSSLLRLIEAGRIVKCTAFHD